MFSIIAVSLAVTGNMVYGRYETRSEVCGLRDVESGTKIPLENGSGKKRQRESTRFTKIEMFR